MQTRGGVRCRGCTKLGYSSVWFEGVSGVLEVYLPSVVVGWVNDLDGDFLTVVVQKGNFGFIAGRGYLAPPLE